MSTMFEFLTKFFDEKKYFLSTVTVSSYLPGRIRCYSSLLKGNEENATLLKEYFLNFPELTECSINTVTGSVLLVYDVAKIALNKELLEIEQCLKQKAQH